MGDGDVEAVKRWMVESSNTAEFDINFAVVFDGVGVFETPEDGYAFYLKARRAGRLAEVQNLTSGWMGMEGFELSPFSLPSDWHPHLTIGYSDTPAERLSPSMSIGFVPPGPNPIRPPMFSEYRGCASPST